MQDTSTQNVHEWRAPVPLRLSLLWTSVMFLYVYGDHFGLFRPGVLMRMNEGIIAPLGTATPGILLGVAVMMAIPSFMIAASALLPARLNRLANVVTGLLYSAIVAVTVIGAPLFYMFLSVIEIALTLTIAVTAWRWSHRLSKNA